MDQAEANGRQLLASWDELRGASGAEDGDRQFRHHLMEYIPAELERLGGPADERRHAHAASAMALVDVCESAGRFADALTVTEWVAREHVPRGGDLGIRIVWACADACQVAAASPALFDRAAALLEWVADAAPDRADGAPALAASRALLVLAGLHQATTDRENHSVRAREVERVLSRVVAAWKGSTEPVVRAQVHSARLSRALVRIELADDAGARADVGAIADGAARDVQVPGVDELVAVARHAVPVLDWCAGYPAPGLDLSYLKAQRRRDLREGRLRTFARNNPARYAETARAAHRRTVRMLSRSLVTGLPVVLLLRSFEMVETSHLGEVLISDAPGGQEFVRRIAVTRGGPLVDRLGSAVDVVSVSNAAAGELELDAVGTDFGRPTLRWPLYLANDSWLDRVAELVAVADVIVVWTSQKSVGVVQELEVIQRLGRAGDAYALLEPHVPDVVYPALVGQGPPATEPLLPGDPLLAGFRRVSTVGDPGAAADLVVDEVVRTVQSLGARDRLDRIAALAARAGEVWGG